MKLVDSASKANRAVVIDVSNMAYRALFSRDLNTSDGRVSGHVYGLFDDLLYVFKNFKQIYGDIDLLFVFCYDGAKSKDRRREILPGYKVREKNRFNPLPDAERACLTIPGYHIKNELFEADDAIYWATKVLSKKLPVTIYSSDKDVWGLIGTADIWSPNKKTLVKIADLEKEYKTSIPENVYTAKAFFGDNSDKIKGIDRLQKKAMAPYLSEYRTPEQIYSVLESNGFKGFSNKAPKSKDGEVKLSTQEKLIQGKTNVLNNFAVVLPQLGLTKDDLSKVETHNSRSKIVEIMREFELNSILLSSGIFSGGQV